MTTTELIKLLQESLGKHGDIPVYDTNGYPIIGISQEAEIGSNRAYIESEF